MATNHTDGVDADYLQRAAEMLKAVKQRTYTLMHCEKGCRVLDAGCGPGLDTVALAHIVGPAGKVMGVDFDAELLAEADARAQAAGVSRWTTHHHGDVTALPFEPDRFDAARCERVLQHLPDPAKALSELIRVTKPGGWIVLADTDWSSLSADSPEVDVERRLARLVSEEYHVNGSAGRQLPRLMHAQGLTHVAVEPMPVCTTSLAEMRVIVQMDAVEQIAVERGVITPDELRRWQTSLGHAAATGTFYAHYIIVVAAGKKP